MKHRALLSALILAAGVPALLGPAARAADWPQWRGIQRDGISAEVPQQLPAKKLLWSHPMAGENHGGIAVSGNFVVLPDHGGGQDFVRCYRADTGAEVWTHSTPNTREMDCGAGSRTTPLIQDGRVYTLSAVGGLFCFELATGKVVWKMHVPTQFKAKVPEWGYCASPIIAGGKLILNPGTAAASMAAVDPTTGKVLWQTPGGPVSYCSFIAGKFGGVEQVVGYDQVSLGGWSPANGKRIWTLTQENPNDYNVGTPLNLDGKLLVSTDGNNTRVHSFGAGGVIKQKPDAMNEDLRPDMATPVVVKGLVFGPTYGLMCLDLADGLKKLWVEDKEEQLTGFHTYIAGSDRVMVFTETGQLYLVAADAKGCRILGKMDVCGKTWAHPALADGRLFVRDAKTLSCYEMK